MSFRVRARPPRKTAVERACGRLTWIYICCGPILAAVTEENLKADRRNSCLGGAGSRPRKRPPNFSTHLEEAVPVQEAPTEKSFSGRSLVAIRDLSRAEIDLVLQVADRMANGEHDGSLRGCQVALLFYEASTRTRNSFLTAVHQLGATSCGFTSAEGTSVEKGETLHDTIRMFEAYSQAIVLRHPRDGAARWAADLSQVPVLNAGDGKNQHPTQTLLDLHAIRATQGRLTDLRVALAGDLKFGRTVHSLADALALYPGNRLYLASPPSLRMPPHLLEDLRAHGVEVHERERIEEVVREVDILYVTRIQRERLPDETEYVKVRGTYRLTVPMLERIRSNLKVLHPLPRVDEIAPDVDSTPFAYYFQQAAGGVPVRKALLWLLLGGGHG
ncbi:MAG: aspartate carbamoyltransferase [Armatimonadetes bacterium]|nr:aspartate carbamoyltransferase [Armatimonadota bacterium]